MRHRDLTLLKRIRRPVGYDRTTVGGIDEKRTLFMPFDLFMLRVLLYENTGKLTACGSLLECSDL